MLGVYASLVDPLLGVIPPTVTGLVIPINFELAPVARAIIENYATKIVI
jgi:hypothetical protein